MNEVTLTQSVDPGDIVFYVEGGIEKLRISSKGFFIEGREVSGDKEIYQQMKAFLEGFPIGRPTRYGKLEALVKEHLRVAWLRNDCFTEEERALHENINPSG